MRRLLSALVVLGLIGLTVFWFVTAPPAALAAVPQGEAERGERIFWAAGCASCHVEEGAPDGALPVLGGGKRFDTPFGQFVAPNISSDPVHGVGAWSDDELVTAIVQGVSPEGEHYFPAFPYTSYGLAEVSDIADLVAFMRTLPASQRPSEAHDVPFPFNVRRSVGGWKLLFRPTSYATVMPDGPAQRGQYLAEALAHCGECHTPRGPLGNQLRDRWMAGAPNPSGKGNIPNITPAELDWSERDVQEYLTSGFTPEFDTAGGSMALVVEHTARLPEEDRAALAAYVKALAPAE